MGTVTVIPAKDVFNFRVEVGQKNPDLRSAYDGVDHVNIGRTAGKAAGVKGFLETLKLFC